jgi:hypothetical protein
LTGDGSSPIDGSAGASFAAPGAVASAGAAFSPPAAGSAGSFFFSPFQPSAHTITSAAIPTLIFASRK